MTYNQIHIRSEFELTFPVSIFRLFFLALMHAMFFILFIQHTPESFVFAPGYNLVTNTKI